MSSRNRRRVLIAFGIAVLLCSVYLWLFGFQTIMISEARWIGRKAPVVWQTPQALADASITTDHGVTLSYFGYQFDVPWDDLDESKTRLYSKRVVLGFRSGRAMIFSAVPPRSFISEIVSMDKSGAFPKIYGDAPTRSDYAMWKLILETTPGNISLFSSRNEIAGTPTLLTIKAITMPEQSGIFSVQTNDLKGFQWGDPKARPRSVTIQLFEDEGSAEFVLVGPGKGQPLGISQADINRIVQSVRKTTPESKNKAAALSGE